jgi:hypothetical protein
MKSKTTWPFDQPPNCAVFTTLHVIDGSERILEVYHDSDDHGWQFFGLTGGTMQNAAIVALQEIVAMDPSVLEIADLAPGWSASRENPNSSWFRHQAFPKA